MCHSQQKTGFKNIILWVCCTICSHAIHISMVCEILWCDVQKIVENHWYVSGLQLDRDKDCILWHGSLVEDLEFGERRNQTSFEGLPLRHSIYRSTIPLGILSFPRLLDSRHSQELCRLRQVARQSDLVKGWWYTHFLSRMIRDIVLLIVFKYRHANCYKIT